jgi:hypothetical protein
MCGDRLFYARPIFLAVITGPAIASTASRNSSIRPTPTRADVKQNFPVVQLDGYSKVAH